MKHKTSILICTMDDGTRDVFVNGAHCYRDAKEVLSPEKLVDKVSRRSLIAALSGAEGVVADIMVAENKEDAK